MKKILVGMLAALLCFTMSGCSIITGGMYYLAAVALAVVGIGLFIFAAYRVKQRMNLLKRHSRSFPKKALRKADFLTGVISAFALAFIVSSLVTFSYSSRLVIPSTSPTDLTVEDPAAPDLPWMTFPKDKVIEAENFFVYSVSQNLYLTSGEEDENSAKFVEDDFVIDPKQMVTVFTAFIASERIEPNDLLNVTEEMLAYVPEGAVKCGFPAGTKQSAKTVVEAMLVGNASDAAYILAANIGQQLLGSAEVDKSTIPVADALARFVEEMNTRGRANGLTNTTFVNPDGAPQEGQTSTVGDMIKLTELVAPYKTIMTFLQTDSFTFAPNEYDTFEFTNENRLVVTNDEFSCPYARGFKLMYSDDTSYDLIAVFRSNGQKLVVGVFGCESAEDAFMDTLHLYNSNMGVY